MPDPYKRAMASNFDERTKYLLNPQLNILQEELDTLNTFTGGKHLKIRERKTQITKFNFNQNLDFPSELIVNGFKENLAVVKETKLFGIIRDDLIWNSNTQYLCPKACKRMWSRRPNNT